LTDTLWKDNWPESRQHYLDWWAGDGLVISMWGHLKKDGAPHEPVQLVPTAKDLDRYWFDPEWRAANLHFTLSRSSFKADILPVANTHLGPGSLAAILGASLDGNEGTIWIHPRPWSFSRTSCVADRVCITLASSVWTTLKTTPKC
jgi:hypothetical protein